MTISLKNNRFNRRGLVIFVVLGAILVLGVLVTSYNFFVRGKLNESLELLMHLRAVKCAEATSSFIFSRLLSDLQSSGDASESATALKKVFMSYNSPDDLCENVKNEWYNQIDSSSFVSSLLADTIGDEDFDYDVDFIFSDVCSLSEKFKDSKAHFFQFEKVGRLTISVTVWIGRTREVWQETRPFKVVFPFPVPLTKFTFYWKDGVSGLNDQYSFNTVDINAEDGSARSKRPFVLDNGFGQDKDANHDDNAWVDRGWIYIGGSNLMLNRANGVKKFGQRYHSYPRPGLPATLLLSFPGGDRWDREEHKYNGEQLGFRIAHWGFSDALKDSNSSWQKILNTEFFEHPYDSDKNYWQSSVLQLFSNVSAYGGNDNEFIPTITRITGNVYDRFLEMGYLLPINSNSDSVFAAVKNYNCKQSYVEASNPKKNSSNNKVGINNIKYDDEEYDDDVAGLGSVFPFENYLFFPGGEDSVPMELSNVLKSYFNDLSYYDDGDNKGVSYSKVMSKVTYRSYDETYSVISAYSKNSNEISLPPKIALPRTIDDDFVPKSYGGEFNLGQLNDDESIRNYLNTLKISDIYNPEDATLGLKYRTCYKLTGTSEEIDNSLCESFGDYSNGYGLNLNNLVYRISSSDDTLFLEKSLKTLNSSGAILSDGPVRLTSFSSAVSDSLSSPVMVLAEKGAITVDNDGNNDVRAYLVALGEGGTVKASKANASLKIIGGMAVKEFSAENLPDGGGYLNYNINLDPIRNVGSYVGIVFGPKGGKP